MAQYHLSHPFADRMREHFVATLAEFVGRMKVNNTDKGLKVNISPINTDNNSISLNKQSLMELDTTKKAGPARLIYEGEVVMQVPPDEPGES
jgi:hypothetical protein